MNDKSLIETIGKILFVVGAFIVPMIFKYLKKQKEERARNTKPYSKPATNLRPKIQNTHKKEVNFNEIMSDIFGAPEVKPVRVKSQNLKPKQPYSGPDFKKRKAEKLPDNLPSEKRFFEKINLKENTVAKVTMDISEAFHLTGNMTNHDWKKAIIMKEILDAPIALRNI